jgi:hypothetical protein
VDRDGLALAVDSVSGTDDGTHMYSMLGKKSTEPGHILEEIAEI